MRPIPRRDDNSWQPTVEKPWGDKPRTDGSGTYQRVREEAPAPRDAVLVIRPAVELRLDGVLIHVEVINRLDPDKVRVLDWTAGPFATGPLARDGLEQLLTARLKAASGAYIEVSAKCYATVPEAMEALWPRHLTERVREG